MQSEPYKYTMRIPLLGPESLVYLFLMRSFQVKTAESSFRGFGRASVSVSGFEGMKEEYTVSEGDCRFLFRVKWKAKSSSLDFETANSLLVG